MRISIIGAGIVGLATAHALLDEGHSVTLIDRGGREARPTEGNAGWIAHLDIMPLASPRIWRQLPGWLMDPLGPLTVRPAYLPKLAPWLIRFLLASSPHRIEASVQAISQINAQALAHWQARLDALGLGHHLQRKGIVSVWRRADDFTRCCPIISHQRGLGIATEVLSGEDIAAMEPALHGTAAGVLYPDGCHMADPAALAAQMLTSAVERGASLVAHDALVLQSRERGIALHTRGDAAPIVSERVVIAAGAWSKPFARQMGDRIPLDTERGYNATFPSDTFGLSRPVMFEGEGFVTTPLGIGDRVGGAVEFAGLTAKANHARTDAIVKRLGRFLPHLRDATPTRRWMGLRPSIPDSLPVIGPSRDDPRVLYNFGHGHHGLTQAAVSAAMVASIIGSRAHDVAVRPFSPSRFALWASNPAG